MSQQQNVSGVHRSGRAALLLALVGLVLAGCGGKSGGGSSDATPSAPKITTQPKSKSAAVGSSVTFSVKASSSESVTYQWYKGSDKISGATSSTYTIDEVKTSSFGTYYVGITNSQGTTISTGAVLSAPVDGSPTIDTQPTSLVVPTGGTATFTVVASGDGLSYQWYKDDSVISGATSASYTIDPVKTSSAGNYFVRVTNSIGSVDSSTVGLSISSSSVPVITSQPVSKSVNLGGSTGFSVVASGTGLSYQWYKDGAAISGATGSTISISGATSESAGGYSVVITNSFGSTTSNTATLTVVSIPVITSQPTSQTVNNGASASFTVGVTGTGLSYKWFKVGGATVSTSATLTLTGSTSTAGNYKVTITNSAGSVTSDTFTLTVIQPPTITSQPSSLTVGLGSSASFSVTATGVGTLKYQWYKNGGTISGATSSTYTIGATVAGDAATYKVTVTNDAGTTTSNNVTLTVDQPPVITNQPGSLTVTAGSSATFSVTATASGALTYQWYKNGALISGATNASYTIASAAESDEATYKVVVTNDGVISTTSNNATLTVN